jgi:hypothetical protein
VLSGFPEIPRINVKAYRVFLHMPQQQSCAAADIQHDSPVGVVPDQTGEHPFPVAVKEGLNTEQVVGSHHPVVPFNVDVVLLDLDRQRRAYLTKADSTPICRS